MKKLKVSDIQGQRTPDFEVTDPQTEVAKRVEVKQVGTNNPRTILSRVSEALQGESFQSGTIIIDATVMAKEVALEGLKLLLTELNRRRLAKLKSVRIIGRDFDISTTYPEICL